MPPLLHVAGFALCFALFGVFLWVGYRAARRVKEGNVGDLLVAGRELPLWLATLTMTATWVDGGYLLGTAEGTQTSLGLGLQGGVCFGLSLILGGLAFAATMRRYGFSTLVDPFESRFGGRWAAVLAIPAMIGELLWSGELLVALGATVGTLLDFDLTTAIVLSAVAITSYTYLGGLWSVAYTDMVQLALVPIGMLAALPFVLPEGHTWSMAWREYSARHALGPESWPARIRWTDASLMLILGGIPWNCYFQRVLACQSPGKARWHSLTAGLLTIVLTIPPAAIGVAAATRAWSPETAAALAAEPARTLPIVLRDAVPGWVSLLGLAAILGAVTSSFSASVLSAASLLGWNVGYRLLYPQATSRVVMRWIRAAILFMAGGAIALALSIRSVQALWFFTADLVYVLLFPQLVAALFDAKANRFGSMAAFGASLALRLAGGEPLLGLPALVPYGRLLGRLLPGGAEAWHDAAGGDLFPFRSVAMLVGLALIPLVSRATARWSPPQPLRGPLYGGTS